MYIYKKTNSMATWVCWYVDDFSNIVSTTIDSSEYSGTCVQLQTDNPDLFQMGVSENGDKALMCKVPASMSTPVSADVNGIPQISTNCILDFGGHPKPPNK